MLKLNQHLLYKISEKVIYIYVYTVPSTNIGTLGKYEQGWLWK